MNAFWLSTVVIFLAELGDKTMLATITLATRDEDFWSSFGTWIGSTLGMVAADAIAIAGGAFISRKVSTRVVTFGAAAAFFAFGLLLIVQGLGQRP